MKKFLLSLSLLLAPMTLSAAPLAGPADELASNTVTAVYEKIVERPCHFRTIDCPDKCGHGVKFARFRVITNEAYSRPGEYGDDKAEPGTSVAVDILGDVEGQEPAVKELVLSLKPGDCVRMTLKHYYVKTDHAHYPVRPVTEIQRIEAPKRMPEKKDSPLDHAEEIMPLSL